MSATAATADTTIAGSAVIPEAVPSMPPSPRADIDRALRELSSNKDRWAAVGIPQRVSLLERLIGCTLAVSRRWVDVALEAKGIRPGSATEGEEWLAGPMVTIRNMRLLARSLRDVASVGYPRTPGKPYVRAGRVAVPVSPTSFFDRVLFAGFSAEVWMRPGVTLENLRETQAVAYRRRSSGKVALVLGAGNVSSIGPMDALYKLFAENQVVVLKMNPVNEYLGPVLGEALRPLIDEGFLRLVYGGAAEGAYLCQHELVDEIHITGSDKTHDAIVFGGGAEGKRNKASRTPINTKRITSELGNVSPIIVVPGPWNASDLRFHGANLASMLTNNAGFNCNATRVIVQHAAWPQRGALLDAARAVFAAAPARRAYYPGAGERYRSFLAAHPQAEQLGRVGDGELPWMLVSGLDPSRSDDICFTTEAFCSVTSEVGLAAESVADYVRRAVRFANETLWGSLNAGIIVHPRSLREPAVALAVEQAVADLRAGSVVVNHWPALSYAMVSTTWGAYPGHDVYDIRSGSGVVHNTYLFDQAEKSVIRGPFRVFPKPPWFVTNRRAHAIGERMTRFEAAPSPWQLPGLLWEALRG
jgi:acyl-CoA reductase-like NAD-dependent aldehyde dehydrogenase